MFTEAALPAQTATPASAHSSRRRDLLQFLGGYLLIMAVIWAPRACQRPLYLSAVLFIVASMWYSFEGWPALGLRRRNLLRSLWIPFVALFLAALAVLAALHEHTLHPDLAVALYLKSFWGYAIWSFAQQLLLQGFFLQRLIRLLPSPRIAAFAAAGIFAIAHLPNPILTILTIIWGTVACLLFLRYRNLYPIAVAHAILGICVAVTLPAPLIRNMRVGLGYLNYPRHHHMPDYRNHVPHAVSTHA